MRAKREKRTEGAEEGGAVGRGRRGGGEGEAGSVTGGRKLMESEEDREPDESRCRGRLPGLGAGREARRGNAGPGAQSTVVASINQALTKSLHRAYWNSKCRVVQHKEKTGRKIRGPGSREARKRGPGSSSRMERTQVDETNAYTWD